MKTIKDNDDLQTIEDNHLKKILMDLRRDKLIPRGYRPIAFEVAMLRKTTRRTLQW